MQRCCLCSTLDLLLHLLQLTVWALVERGCWPAAAHLAAAVSGVLGWWAGLVGALHEKPEEWRADAFTSLPSMLTSMQQQYLPAPVRGCTAASAAASASATAED
jgi:hypothetical protein